MFERLEGAKCKLLFGFSHEQAQSHSCQDPSKIRNPMSGNPVLRAKLVTATYLIGQDTVLVSAPQVDQPIETSDLEVLQF